MFLRRNFNKKLFRPGVGLVLFNQDKNIFVGQRLDLKTEAWQLPQGGVDPKENYLDAAYREALEEIGTQKIKFVAQGKRDYSYTFPSHLKNNLWNGRFKGQVQKWYLFYFWGSDEDINIFSTDRPEFRDWKWVPPREILPLAAPFKKHVYSGVLNEFLPIIESFKKHPQNHRGHPQEIDRP